MRGTAAGSLARNPLGRDAVHAGNMVVVHLAQRAWVADSDLFKVPSEVDPGHPKGAVVLAVFLKFLLEFWVAPPRGSAGEVALPLVVAPRVADLYHLAHARLAGLEHRVGVPLDEAVLGGVRHALARRGGEERRLAAVEHLLDLPEILVGVGNRHRAAHTRGQVVVGVLGEAAGRRLVALVQLGPCLLEGHGPQLLLAPDVLDGRPRRREDGLPLPAGLGAGEVVVDDHRGPPAVDVELEADDALLEALLDDEVAQQDVVVALGARRDGRQEVAVAQPALRHVVGVDLAGVHHGLGGRVEDVGGPLPLDAAHAREEGVLVLAEGGLDAGVGEGVARVGEERAVVGGEVRVRELLAGLLDGLDQALDHRLALGVAARLAPVPRLFPHLRRG
mmetsp:Transcript_52047/g.136063  ORF Transcript_52047/g.136063 Transcript_52047/m.136063 type:complete len:390 (-) Transcript_52047:601-1770(-)